MNFGRGRGVRGGNEPSWLPEFVSELDDEAPRSDDDDLLALGVAVAGVPFGVPCDELCCVSGFDGVCKGGCCNVHTGLLGGVLEV